MTIERDFLEAFSAAAHDVELEERGFEIFHFFDSDFIGRITFGYRDDLNLALLLQRGRGDVSGASGQRLLMSALVGQRIGAPPLARVLAPHLHEVQLQVERASQLDEPIRREHAISALGLRPQLGRLIEEIRDGDSERILDLLIRSGPELFYGVELLSGSWQSRLGRVLELGIGNSSPFDQSSDVVTSRAFIRILKLVGTPDHSGNPSGAAGVRDAMALAMLAEAVSRAARSAPPFPVVRFYTETRRIERAWGQSDELRRLLTYPHPEGSSASLGASVHGVLRSTYYYLIRALIPELGYDQSTRSGDNRESVPSIYSMCRDLAEAVDEFRRGGIGDDELVSMPIGGRTLGQYMADVTDLSAYSTAWRRLMGNVPKGLPEEFRSDLQEVIEGRRRHSRVLDALFRRQVAALAT